MKSSHPALRIIAVIGLSLFFCITYLPDLVRVMGYPNGDWGFRTNGTAITLVEPNSPAERAGIRVGDRIDLSQLPIRSATPHWVGWQLRRARSPVFRSSSTESSEQ